MALFKISKGPAARLESEPPHDGYCWFTPDNGKFYIDVAKQAKPGEEETIERVALNAAKADSALSITINSINEDINHNISITPAEHQVYLNNTGIDASENIAGLGLKSGDLILSAGVFNAADIDAVPLSGEDGILMRQDGNPVKAQEYYKDLMTSSPFIVLEQNSNNIIGHNVLKTETYEYKTCLVEIYDTSGSYLTHLIASLDSAKTRLCGSINTYTNNNDTITPYIYYFQATRNKEEDDFTCGVYKSYPSGSSSGFLSCKIKLIGLL